MKILIAIIILLAANIIMAAVHAFLIKRAATKTPPDPHPIKHGWWAAGYFVFAGILSYWNHSWWLLGLSLLMHKVFLDLPLNLFRFGWGQLFYVSPEVKNVTGLWDAIFRKGKTIDWLHYKVFGFRSEIYMTIYFIAIIVATILLVKI